MIRIFSLILLTLSLYGCATMPVKTNVNGTTLRGQLCFKTVGRTYSNTIIYYWGIAVFIFCWGRPHFDNTYQALRKHGYTGRIVLIVIGCIAIAAFVALGIYFFFKHSKEVDEPNIGENVKNQPLVIDNNNMEENNA